MNLIDEISELEKRLIILKGLNARNSEYPPIKLPKNQTSLKLITGKGYNWLFEDIHFELNKPLGTFKANVTSELYFSNKKSLTGIVNDDSEIIYMKIHTNSDDIYVWSDEHQCYLRSFYDGWFDIDRVDNIVFKRNNNK